ncbi:MAG: glycosyltransferase family 2 protein, partial [Lachnospiraceae bacterium]|nr:glycosyltransferase family 2 protein [Lachnospiraceae bacterium]
VFIFIGTMRGVRFLFFYFNGNGGGHVPSLILATMMIIIGFQTFVTGLQADIISANRKILEDIQYRVKKLEFGLLDPDGNTKENEL